MDPKNLSNLNRPFEAGSAPRDTYKDFDATELYCPRCGQAMPVRKRLLLLLPQGDLYEYLCAHCLESVGTKMVHATPSTPLIV